MTEDPTQATGDRDPARHRAPRRGARPSAHCRDSQDVPKPTPGDDALPPAAGLVPPPKEPDAAVGDTTEFTLSDITLSGAGGSRVLTWLRGCGHRLGSLIPGRHQKEAETGRKHPSQAGPLGP